MNTDLPAVSANGGGQDRGGHGPRGGRSRRAKNRRYRHNRQLRSRLLLCGWNAEGLRKKIPEFSRWLSEKKVDVAAVQEAQLSAKPLSIPGYQTAAVRRRARGRRGDGPVKGGDVAIFVRDGLAYTTIETSPLRPDDNTTEWCAVRIITNPRSPSSRASHIDIFNVYRPPIRNSEDDERVDRFTLDRFPTNAKSIIIGDINGHHPDWDANCLEPDQVGTAVNNWTATNSWIALNSGVPTCTGYGERTRLTAPDVTLVHRDLARRCTWSVGEDLGSDHLPQVVTAVVDGSRPRRIRKTRWAFHKADWTAYTEKCEAAIADLPLDSLPVETLASRLTEIIQAASVEAIPRGARADPKPWACDPEVEEAVRERREARTALHEHPDAPGAVQRWKEAKKKAAETETAARQQSFRALATTELNKPTAIGRVTKILRKMEGTVQDPCPGQAINGDRGQSLAADRAKADAFVRTYAGVSRNARVKRRDRPVKTELRELRARPCCCEGERTQACQPFTMQELRDQLQHMKPRKAPGPDQVCTEHLQHLGPIARRALLHTINRSWLTAEVPSAWKRATIIPIPKAGKDPKAVESYRPIALTSHVAKLAERMVAARLTHLIERDDLIPAEQVGFRRGRSAEDNLARLVQSVQDGWNRPKPRGRPTDGVTADKFVLLAFDFSRAYDKIDHRMLQLKLLRKKLPRCMVNWVYQFLRDRRARAEVNGTLSSERIFRAGLPQGSVLAPTLYTLWSADLIEALRDVTRTDIFMYADDTATLSAGSTIEEAQTRAQQAADVMARWADQWKMVIAGHKTQALVLSQWARDARNLQIKVAGSPVPSQPHLKLLGVTFDRLLHFGEHCNTVRRKVKPRIAQLRQLTGRSWGLRERQLRTVANGYVRGALEFAAAAWLPAASETHVDTIDKELRAAARVVTGCPQSTPSDPLMVEAGLPTARSRRRILSARMVCRATSLPEGDPLREVAETNAARRLATSGWRDIGREALSEAGLADVRVEERLNVTAPPWTTKDGVNIALDVGTRGRRSAPDAVRRSAAEEHLAGLPSRATWIWSDGSAVAGTTQGGGGALIILPSGETREVRTAAGKLCSSTRAELCALKAALEAFHGLEGDPTTLPLVVCTDSQAALALLAGGAAEQTSPVGAEIWRLLSAISSRGQDVHLQWVPAHCGLEGNERADILAKEASGLPQAEVPVDAGTMTKAVSRVTTKKWTENRPDSLHKRIMGSHMPPPIAGEDREAAVDVHQLRAGHWGRSLQYLHRIGRNPSPACQQCTDKRCPAALCAVCREEADTPEHVLLRCPSLAGARLLLRGSIHLDPQQLQDDALVASLAGGYLRHREPLGYGPR